MNVVVPLRMAGQSGIAPPFVSVVLPVLNESAYIADCIASLLGQWPDAACEFLVMDGGSTDDTVAIVTALAEQNPSIKLHHNPARIQSAGVNLAVRLAAPQASILVRADAHALYPANFIARCVEALAASGATSVVVPMRTRGAAGGGLQHAIAAAQSSRLGNGGAAHRIGAASGFVGHGHHAAFDMDFFRALGGYDETFTYNEDAEFDLRAIAAGGRIWMCADAAVIYFPRSRFGGLARQYFRHGTGRARTLLKHRLPPHPRQMIPVAVLAGCLAGLAATPFSPAFASVALVYPAVCLAWGMALALRLRDRRLIAAGPALVTMHMAWAIGLVTGLARRHARDEAKSAVPR